MVLGMWQVLSRLSVLSFGKFNIFAVWSVWTKPAMVCSLVSRVLDVGEGIVDIEEGSY
jgi:hypothetical protein